MQHAPCPSCGASIPFRAPTSVLAVCGYCRTTVAREAGAVRQIGRMADLLEDYSPIQLGTTGTWEHRAFTVLGRRQLQYERGLWSEWYVLFADGGTGWLGDFSGQFVMTVEVEPPPDSPSFEKVKPGHSLAYRRSAYRAADIRRAKCVAGSGELPFPIQAGQDCPVVDWRAGKEFLTLDWSAGDKPRAYAGTATTLGAMRCQFVRGLDDIVRTAGRVRGAVKALECPNCGAGLSARAGVATHLVCGACHADVDASGDTATVLTMHREISTLSTTFVPGEQARIGKHRMQIIGVLRMRETNSGESSLWTEYLLYSPARGFLWLVESDEGWDRVAVPDDWPDPFSESDAQWRGQRFPRKWEYGSEIVYAAGAFPWRARVGDTARLVAYSVGKRTLTMERTSSELVWTLSESVSAAEVKAWFSDELQPDRPVKPSRPLKTLSSGTTLSELKGPAIVSTIVLVGLNVPIALFSDSPVFVSVVTFLAALLLWMPPFGWITDLE